MKFQFLPLLTGWDYLDYPQGTFLNWNYKGREYGSVQSICIACQGPEFDPQQKKHKKKKRRKKDERKERKLEL
jgi:hypothetical protein